MLPTELERMPASLDKTEDVKRSRKLRRFVYCNCRLRRGKAAKMQQSYHRWRRGMVLFLGLVGSAAARMWQNYMKPSSCWIRFATLCNTPTNLAVLENWRWPFLEAHLYHSTAVSRSAELVIAVNLVVCVLCGCCGLSLHVMHRFPVYSGVCIVKLGDNFYFLVYGEK